MTADNLRASVVTIGLSREKKNQYTRASKRTQVSGGWSDCSSFVRWCYLQVTGQDIGLTTADQITNDALIVVDSSGGVCPDERLLLPGDLVYYIGSDASRPFQVGHVELYIGEGKLLGHGSGVGPTKKTLKDYSVNRQKRGRGYIRTLRVIPNEVGHAIRFADPAVKKPVPSSFVQTGNVRITGEKVNIRQGPGMNYDVIRVAKVGEIYMPVDTSGWQPVLLYGKVCWVSTKMSEQL